MLLALILLNLVHPGRIMPGKESDLPSRRQRKAAGKNNVRGRAGIVGALPLYETAPSSSSNIPSGSNPIYPKIDGSTVTPGYVNDYDR